MKNHLANKLGVSALSGLMLVNTMLPAYAAKDDDDGPYTIPKMQKISALR